MKTIYSRSQLLILFLLLLTACTLPGATATSNPEPADIPQEAAPVANAAPTEIPFEPSIAVIGPEEIVFDWSDAACEPEDIPDLPARAFRDGQGQVHLISSHLLSRANIGPDLNNLTHPCEPIMTSGHDGDPSKFNDNQWIAATYTLDGKTIYAIIHNEYHGWEHADCAATTTDYGCWYNSLTLAVSHDGGQTFNNAAPPPDHFVAGLPYPYEAGAGPYGIFEPSNILQAKDGYYYQMIRVDDYKSDAQWSCLMRTDDLANPSSWRAWDGESFSMTFIDPYAQPDTNPNEHICAKLGENGIGILQQSLTYNTYLDRYVLLGLSADHIGGREVWDIYYSFSENLVDWTHRQLLWEVELNWTWQPGDKAPIGYPTLIDPDSPSLSFDTTDKQVYLYYTKFNAASPLDRDLIRVPVEFFDNKANALTADTRTKLFLKLGDFSEQGAALSGRLIATDGRPMASQTINFFATFNEGPGQYYEYQLSGRIPPNATRAIIGYRVNIECNCSGAASEFSLYKVRFQQAGSTDNLVPNPNFASGLSGATVWNGPALAKIEASDRDEGHRLHVVAAEGQSSAGDLANFQVIGGESYTVTFAAQVPPAAQGTGFFVLVFLDNNGELIRHSIYFNPPAVQIGASETDVNGDFEFNWLTSENNNFLEAVFLGDAPYLPSSDTLMITQP